MNNPLIHRCQADIVVVDDIHATNSSSIQLDVL